MGCIDGVCLHVCDFREPPALRSWMAHHLLTVIVVHFRACDCFCNFEFAALRTLEAVNKGRKNTAEIFAAYMYRIRASCKDRALDLT